MQTAIENSPGGSASLGAVALTAPALAVALLAPLAGYLVDRLGRRPMLLCALFLYGFVGILPFWLDATWSIIGARFALGAVEAVILAANFSLLSGYFSGARLDRWIAYNGTTIALAATAFYLGGGFLGQIGWKVPFLAYALAFPICLLVAWKVFEPAGGPSRHTAAAQLGVTEFVRRLGVLVVISLAGSVFFYIVPLQLGHFLVSRGVSSPAEIGMFIAVAGLSNPIGALSFRFLRAFPTAYLLGASSFVAAAGLAIAAIVPGPIALGIGAFVNQAGCGLFIPAAVAAVLRQAPEGRVGTSTGAFYTAFFVGQFISPLVVLRAIEGGGPDGALYTLAIANLVFGIVCWTWIKTVRPIQEPASA